MWGLFKQYINIDNIIGDSYVLSWAAKWHGSDEVIYSSRGMTTRKNMIKEIYDLINEADVVVTFNGDRFDLKILNMEFMELGFPPPAPYKSVDLLKTVKRQFRGTSNKMDYWLKKLDLGAKIKHRGPKLWLDCMNGDKASFGEMEEYNIGDVTELEGLYDRILAWIPNHPSHSVFEGRPVCTNCGGTHVHSRGPHRTTAGITYQRYQCANKGCGKWLRGTVRQGTTTERFVAI